MIVTRRHASLIHSGRKRQHRIVALAKPYDPLQMLNVSYIAKAEGIGPRATVNVRVCRVVVLDCREALLEDTTDEDAKAEGFKDRRALLTAWGNPDRSVKVNVLRFKVDPGHSPRLLAASVIPGKQGGYVDDPARALRDEPEAVDEVTLAQFTRAARDRDQGRRRDEAKERKDSSFDEQVQEYTQLARARHIDVRDELRAIARWTDEAARAKQLEKIRQKVEPAMRAVA